MEDSIRQLAPPATPQAVAADEEPITPAPLSGLPWLAHQVVRRAILGIDTIQRRRHRVFEFSDDPDCILRISHDRSRHDRVLSNGERIRRGDRVLSIHYWNERIPVIGAQGADMAWAKRFSRQLTHSFRLLAAQLDASPEFDSVVAILGESSYTLTEADQTFLRFAKRYGFELLRQPDSGRLRRIEEFFVHTWVWSISWAIHPSSLRGKSLREIESGEVWMGRSEFMSRYAGKLSTARSEAAAEPVGTAAIRR